MKYWSRFPVFRVLIPFASGIIYSQNTQPDLFKWLLITISFLLIAYRFTIRGYATGKYAHRWIAGIPFYICYFVLGVLLVYVNNPVHFSNYFSKDEQLRTWLVRIKTSPAFNGKTFRFEAEVVAQQKNHAMEPCRGIIQVTVHDTSGMFHAEILDKVFISCALRPTTEPMNPHTFSYKNYLATKGIFYTAFVPTGHFLIAEKEQSFSVVKYADLLRTKMLGLIQKYVKGRDQQGVAGALLLGYDDWLDPELQSGFATAGVLHVLCVSGMHVGLIYMIFLWLLRWMESHRVLRHIKFILLLGLIWFYALVTGLAPSVMRASTMLTFVILALWLNKNHNVYNTLCISCMFLFILNPGLIVTAGFQLSFLAVCGIIFLHRLILPLVNAPNMLLHRIWELISVSISAQIATFPLSIYLFHQFPNYFLLGNLLVLPLITVIMYSGLALLIFGGFPFAGDYLGMLMSFLTNLLNYLVLFVSSLPGALTENCYLTFMETISIYLLIVLITAWLVYKYKSLMLSVLVSVVILLSLRISRLYEAYNRDELMVYHSRNKAIYSMIKGREAFLIKDSTSETVAINYAASGDLMHKMATITDSLQLPGKGMVYFPGEQLMVIRNWRRGEVLPALPGNVQVKYLILGGRIDADLKEITDKLKPTQIVIDPTCPAWNEKKLVQALSGSGIPVYRISQSGYFQIPLKTIR